MAIVAELLARLGVDTAQFEKELRKAEKAIKKTAANITAAGRSLTAGITLPLAAIGGVALKAFADFDDALTQSTAIIDGTTEQLGRLEKTAREVAKTTVFSAKETAEAFFFLASAGLDVEQSIAARPQVAEFATAGMFDLATATDLATDAQSALGLVVDDATENLVNLQRVTDVLVKANTIANASVRQFSEALTNQAAAAGRAAKLEIEEIVSVLAAFADQGIKGVDAGTKFAIVLRELSTKAAINAKAFKAQGVAVFDANRNLLPFAQIIKNLEVRLQGASVEQSRLTLLTLGFTNKSIGALQALLGTSDALARYKKQLLDSGGITQQVSEKQLESFKNQLSLVKSKVLDVAIELGEVLAPIIIDTVIPAIEAAAKFVERLLTIFGKFSDAEKTATLSAIGFAAAMGPAALGVGILTKALGGLGSVAGRLVPIFAVGGALLLGIELLAAEMAKAGNDASEATMEVEKLAKAAEKLRTENAREAFALLNREFQATSREMEILAPRIEKTQRIAAAGWQEGTRAAEQLSDQFEVLSVKAAKLQEQMNMLFPLPKIDLPEFTADDIQGPEQEFGDRGPFGATFEALAEGFRTARQQSTEFMAALGQDFVNLDLALREPMEGFFGFIGEKQEESKSLWDEYAEFATDANTRVAEIGIAAFDAMAEGLASAIVIAVQGTQDFGDALIDIFSNIFATITQQLISFLIKFIAAKIQIIVFESTAAEAKKGIGGIIAALIAIPILIGATIALANAQSKKGSESVKLASGGLLGADGLAFLHEGERVLTKDEVKQGDAFGAGGLDLTIMMDGRVLARKVLEHMPNQLRLRSV